MSTEPAPLVPNAATRSSSTIVWSDPRENATVGSVGPAATPCGWNVNVPDVEPPAGLRSTARVWTFVFDTARAITVVGVISVGDATSTRLPVDGTDPETRIFDGSTTLSATSWYEVPLS